MTWFKNFWDKTIIRAKVLEAKAQKGIKVYSRTENTEIYF